MTTLLSKYSGSLKWFKHFKQTKLKKHEFPSTSFPDQSVELREIFIEPACEVSCTNICMILHSNWQLQNCNVYMFISCFNLEECRTRSWCSLWIKSYLCWPIQYFQQNIDITYRILSLTNIFKCTWENFVWVYKIMKKIYKTLP